MNRPNFFHTAIVGAGAAGMMCAARIGQAGHSVALIDHAAKIGEKIRISGGGRCNFTNRHLDGRDGSRYYVSEQPRFVRHALARYTAADFCALLDRHGVRYYEKHRGQLFCDHSARDVIAVLQKECALGKVAWYTGTRVAAVRTTDSGFELDTAAGTLRCRHLVIATGGLAAPAVGATPWGYELAKQFGHRIVTPQAALVPLRFEHWAERRLDALAGISLPVRISTGRGKTAITFDEDLLFRHKGLSGPAVLQISSYWQPGDSISINLVPQTDAAAALCQGQRGQKIQLNNALQHICPALPDRLSAFWLAQTEFAAHARHKWADVPHARLQALGHSLNHWTLRPSGSDGHKKAEATRGGVDVREINAKTMMSRRQARLYFIGEVMDVTGWLGGYNFHWAWASAVCAAAAVCAA